MLVYNIFFIVSFLFYYLFGANKYNKSKKIYTILIGIVVFFLFAFRDTSMGMFDINESYVPMFFRIDRMSFLDVFRRYNNDYLFYIITKLITFIFKDVHIWIALMSLPICIAMTKIINKNSNNAWMSWFIFFSLGFFSSNVTIMRQSVAMSFMFFEIISLQDKKIGKAILYSILSFGFHTTGIVSIIPIILWFIKPKMNLKSATIVIIISLIIWHFSDGIIDYFFDIINYDKFQRYYLHLSSFNITLLLINLFIFLFCIIIKLMNEKNTVKNDNVNETVFDYYLWILAISLPILGLTSTFAEMFRVAMYFNFINIILLPNCICYVKNKPIKIIISTIIFGILFYYANVRGLLEVMPYKTFF